MTQNTTKTPVEFRAKTQWLNYLESNNKSTKSSHAFKAAFILQRDEPYNNNAEWIKVLKWHVKTNCYINDIIHLISSVWYTFLFLLFSVLRTA